MPFDEDLLSALILASRVAFLRRVKSILKKSSKEKINRRFRKSGV